VGFRSEARHSIQDVHFRYTECQSMGVRSEARQYTGCSF